MSTGYYRNTTTPDPIVSQIHAMLPNRSQKSTSSGQGSSARPSSAGATRRTSGNFSYNKASNNYGGGNVYNQPMTNAMSSGLFGQGYSAQRPSSAGHSRPTSQPTTATAAAPAYPTVAGLNINQLNMGGSNPANPAHTSTSGTSARPKSAGAVRRNDSATAAAAAAAAAAQQPIYYMPQPATSYAMYANPFGQPSGQRPLSANATSYQNDWGQGYKMPSFGNQAVPQQVFPPQGQQMAQPVGYGDVKQRPQSASSSSSTANKLRKAVDLSHQLEGQDPNGAVYNSAGAAATALEAGMKGAMMKNMGNLPIAELAGLDNEGETEGLDGMLLGVEGVDPNAKAAASGNGDDEEMDGKPISSSSHPEVSTSANTPSASLELANGSSTAVDVRNTSLDSFSEENINVGISTIPNQFCTKRDALELRKLLALSSGTRGGIVPSSSAVMDMYMVGKVVGVGSYGKVRAAWHRLTGSKVAIKTYDKAKLKDPAHWKRVHSEIKIMEQISHPRIARLYEAVETPKRMHLIMECLDGGNLCSYVKAKRRLSEEESKRIFFQIVQAIDYLHGLGVSHRDIKLENVLFANEREIKLIDFGFSTVCQPGKKLKVFCGTPSYMAPEIVRRLEYEGKPVDIWSLGILLYALLCGCFPFRAKAYPDLYRRIARGAFTIPEELSAPVKDLLRQLLTVDVDQRMTAHNALRHPWLQGQLLNAPNMDKMRQEMTILISEKPADDLDEQVLSELQTYGMSRDETIRLVLTKTHSSLATLYYLLLEVLINRRRSAAKRAGANYHNVGPTMNAASALPGTTNAAGNGNGNSGGHQRPMSANYASGLSSGGGVKNIATSLAKVITGPPAMQNPSSQHYENLIQQQMAEQMNAQQQQQQQQQMLERQEYRSRPKSASQNRTMAMASGMPQSTTLGMMPNTGMVNVGMMAAQAVPQQRPLSAYATRR
eukprot:gene1015-1101_t